MISVLETAKGWVRGGAALLGCLALAACDLPAPVAGGNGKAVNRNAPVQVALLVPYGSAQNGDAIVAKALEDAARMAVADLEGVQIDLRVYSTAAQAATGAAAAKKAIAEGAKVILGPLYADVAAAVGVAAAGSNVSVLTFSNNTSIAGGNVYLLGATFQNTAERVLAYAAAQGRNRVVVLHANDTTGGIARNAVTAAAGTTGTSIVAAVPYELSQTGVVNAVPAVRTAVSSQGANAVFLTSPTSGALPIFAQLLPEAGVNPAEVQFLGLSRWDVPAEALELPGLQGGWFAIPDPGLSATFNARFQAANGRSAHPIAGLGYDGIAAIGAAVKSGGAIGAATLTKPSGFAGVNGIFRLKGDGTNQRALAIAQIVNRQLQVISPAPRTFGSAGF
jgi:hypothetical protein